MNKIHNFTFQSGYIQIYMQEMKETVGIVFTFQSGYIQIQLLQSAPPTNQTLHSNLVTFKWTAWKVGIWDCRHFTFQSGYIQINYVTQYDSFYHLYIPIWLYSNVTAVAVKPYLFFFTFQSGYIQIILFISSRHRLASLHSNLVIFKCICKIYPNFQYPLSLHSNLVIFKWYFLKIASVYVIPLHSNLVIFKSNLA